MPKISIIVPVYNVELYLERCLKSLIHQTFQDIEIIIVDDGSPDDSQKIYGAYARQDNRIKVIKKKNAGVSQARNTGIDAATGDLLMFVDSDDWMERDGCETLYKSYEKNKADLIIADVYEVKNVKRHLIHVFNKEFETEGPDFIRRYQMACIGYGYNPLPCRQWSVSGLGSPWNKLYKRNIIVENKLRFDPYVKGIYDDNLFVLNFLSCAKKISYIHKPVYNYRVVEQSITKSYKENTLDISQRIFERIQTFISQQKNSFEFEKAFYNYVIRRLSAELNVYYFSVDNPKDRKKVMEEMKHMLHTEPYQSAIKNVEVERLMLPHKITCFIARLDWPFGMWLNYRIRELIKGIAWK